MFLNAIVLNQDAGFADNGFGGFLQRASVPYTHSQPTLEQPIVAAGQGKIGYDSAGKQLYFNGTLDVATRNALKAVASVTATFRRRLMPSTRRKGWLRMATHCDLRLV